MHWNKLGQIFDTAACSLPLGCTAFAQAPQALPLGDRTRVYFTARWLDQSNGKYLSHVAYADFSPDFATVLDVSRHEVIALGKRGSFDEHGIFPMNVLRHGDEVRGYTSGVNRRSSVPVDGAIGLAVSLDLGRTFERLGDGPVLAPSLHEPCIVVDPCVREFDGLFHMWYVFGLGWTPSASTAGPDRLYKIGHAVSRDGIAWTKDSEGRAIIADRLGATECQAMPSVIRLEDRYHMFFCYRYASDFRSNRERSYRIGHASSADLVTWVRDDDELAIAPGPGAWDTDMLCYPHVVESAGRVYLLYNGNEFGRHGFGVAVLERSGSPM
ncbi:MAG: hypothetical protein Q8O52_09960 [Sulfuritalea sp.]|nr:hypothetical protein [Sulfuritalea sp.]